MLGGLTRRKDGTNSKPQIERSSGFSVAGRICLYLSAPVAKEAVARIHSRCQLSSHKPSSSGN